MRNKITLLLICIFTIQLAAQERRTGDFEPSDHASERVPLKKVRKFSIMVADTILPPVSSTCNDTIFYLYPADSGGYVTGTNYLGDLEKAQLFPSPQPANGVVKGLLVYFGAKRVVGGTDSIAAKIYSEGSNGAPNVLLGVSDSIAVAGVNNPPIPTYFSFDDPVPYTNSFFASIVVDAGDDTVGIEHTEHGCGLGHAYEKWPDESWNRISDYWDDVDVSIEIYAVVDDEDIGIAENIISANEPELYPNPVKDELQLKFDEAPPKDALLKILNIDGTSVMEKKLPSETGRTEFSVLVAALKAGAYILETETGKGAARRVFVKE